MKKLELKHIAPYLLYGLEVMLKSPDNSIEPNIKKVNCIKSEPITNNALLGFESHSYLLETYRCKPILKRLNI